MSNLFHIIKNSASNQPDRPALVFNGHRILYKDFLDGIDRLAQGLKTLGLGPGDRIAVMLPNLPHHPISFFALLKLGVTIVPVSIFFKAEEIHHILEDSEVRGIIYWQGFRGEVLEAVQGLERCESLIVLGDKSHSGEIRLTYLMESNDPASEVTEVDPDDTAFIMYTAGMTGRPRGAELTHQNIYSNVQACVNFLKLSQDDSVIGVLSLHHPMGLTLILGSFLHTGGCVILMPSFNAENILKTIEAEKPTYFVGVPSMYRAFLTVENGENYDLGSLKYFLSSGDAIKEKTMDDFQLKFNTPILEGYGLTEASPMVSFNSPNRDHKAGSVGLPLPGVDMRFVDENGDQIKPGEVGEIVVQGPNVMKGYLNRPEATKEAIKDGWLYTGDLARLQENGFGYIVVRKKDVIVKSGFNVYPREVEKFLFGHPKVKEAVVVGVADPHMGESVHAGIVLKQNETSTAEEIVEYLKERMATYKCPSSIHFMESLPKGPTGRVVRDKVKQLISKE